MPNRSKTKYPIRTFEQYRREFFPETVERERREKLTPEELGAEIARAILETFLKGNKTP